MFLEPLSFHGRKGFQKFFNLDETGYFWRTLPSHGFGERGKKCHGGKKSKQRFTITFLVNAAGAKEKPIVIWIVKNQDVLDINSLPVKLLSSKECLDDWRNSSQLFDQIY